MSVVLVVTEHVEYLPGRERHYDGVGATLARAAADDVVVRHYVDPGPLGSARAVILSGSSAPWAAHEQSDLDRLGEAVRRCGRPVLGICAGMQLLASWAGGAVAPAVTREKGFLEIEVLEQDGLLRGLPRAATVYQDHSDEVVDLPSDFAVLARSDACAVQAIAAPALRWYGTQFHPERDRGGGEAGERVLRNFFALARP